jgi:hypothetical protein
MNELAAAVPALDYIDATMEKIVGELRGEIGAIIYRFLTSL